MKKSIYTVNFDRSEFLEEHIDSILEDKIKPHLKDEILSVQVWLKIENSFWKRGKDSYLCEVKIHTKSFGDFFSKERDEDCYMASKVAISEVLTMVQNRLKTQTQRARKGAIWIKTSWPSKTV